MPNIEPIHVLIGTAIFLIVISLIAAYFNYLRLKRDIFIMVKRSNGRITIQEINDRFEASEFLIRFVLWRLVAKNKIKRSHTAHTTKYYPTHKRKRRR